MLANSLDRVRPPQRAQLALAGFIALFAMAAGAPATPPAPGVQAAAPAASTPAPKVTFRGVVQDDKLQPLAGAKVTVVALPARDPDADDAAPGAGPGGRRGDRGSFSPVRRKPSGTFFEATTDAAGSFTIQGEGAGPFNMRAQAAGFAPTVLEGVQPGAGVSTLFLKKGVVATGVVADCPGGRVVADADVVAELDNDHGFNDLDDPARFHAATRTGKDGMFTIKDLAPGFYDFRVSALGRASYRSGALPVAEGPSRPRTFYLVPGFDASGRVVDQAGKPVPKIDVQASPGRRTGSLFRLYMTGGYDRAIARTDKDGKFTLKGIPLGVRFTAEVDAPGFAPTGVEIPAPRSGQSVSGLEIKLEQGVTLKAKLLDPDQKPVTKDVSLALNYRDPKTRRSIRTVSRGEKEVRISPTGDMTLERIPSGTANITITARGFKTVDRKSVAIGSDNKPADLGTIALERGKAITGKVVDESGAPVASAKVSGSSFAPGRGGSTSQTKTDAAGKFALGGLEDESWTVEASSSGFSNVSQSDVAPEGEPITLTLKKAGTIKGRLVVGDPPRPVVNFSLEANPKSSGGFGAFRMVRPGNGPNRRSDARGGFTLSDLTPGTYTLTCRADGLQDLVRDGIEVRSGETTDLGDLTLLVGGTVRGKVVTKPEGNPVPAAMVRVKSSGLFDMRAMSGDREGTVLTDLGGRFDLRGIPTGTITLVVEPQGYAKTELPGIVVEAGREGDEVTVSVGKGGKIEGRVIGKDGRPQAESMVTAMAGMADFSANLSATTDDDGHYTIDNVPAGSYRVMNFAIPNADDDEGEGGGRARFGGMDAVPAEVKDGETSIVNFGEKKINVTGILKRKSGEVAKQMVVFVPSGGGGGRMAAKIGNTDDTGHYEVTLQSAGEYDVYVGDQGMRGGLGIKATIPDKPDVVYDLTVPEGGLSGRVSAEEGGAPLKGVSVIVSAATAGGERQSLTSRRGGSRATTAEDGTYHVDGLGAGKYDVTFAVDGYATELVQGIEVKGGAEGSVLDQMLKAGLPFKIRVGSPAGSGVQGALVMVYSGGAVLQGVGGMTREDGFVDLKQLKPGVYSFVAIARDYAPGITRDVSLGGEKDGDTAMIALETGGSLRTLVQDGGKSPVSGASITIVSDGGVEVDNAVELLNMMSGFKNTSGADGGVMIEHLPAGKYQVTAERNSKKVTKSVTVEEGGRAELAVTLE